MNLQVGWYVTVSGERAYVAAIVPEEFHHKFYAERHYAIGWVVMKGTNEGHADGDVSPCWWNRLGQYRVGNETGSHRSDLVSREVA